MNKTNLVVQSVILSIAFLISTLSLAGETIGNWEVNTNFRVSPAGDFGMKFAATVPDNPRSDFGTWYLACKKNRGEPWLIHTYKLGMKGGPVFIGFGDQPQESYEVNGVTIAADEVARLVANMLSHSKMTVETPEGQSTYSLLGFSQVFDKYISECPAENISVSELQATRVQNHNSAVADPVHSTSYDPDVFALYVRTRVKKSLSEASQEEKDSVLKELIDVYVLADEAERLGIDSTPSIASQIELQRLAILAQKYAEKYMADNNKSGEDLQIHIAELRAQSGRSR